MNILLLGATGNIGSRILDEALSRGHTVTAVARRTGDLDERKGLEVVEADASKPGVVEDLVPGHEAVVASLSPRGAGGAETYTNALRNVLRLTEPRVVIVGGAGSLEVEPGVELVDTPEFPDEYKPEALPARDIRNVAQGSDARWTYLSPPMVIEPGERTGRYRIGGTQLLTDDEGNSYITMEDFAVALVDELEEPQHERQQFTVAY